MSRALIRYERGEDGVAVITLDDPPANAYSYEMMTALGAAILEARMDEGVHVLLLRGAGEKFFCAGADIRMLSAATPRFKYAFCLHANETLNRLEHTLFESEDAREGIAAHLEKRKPAFRGR